MKRRKRKKDDLLFRGALGASFLLFWAGLVTLGLVSQAMDRDVKALSRTAVLQTFDPSSDPEGFSLYAEFSGTDRTEGVALPADLGLQGPASGEEPGATAFSNGAESRRLVIDD
jgi:hypothetical protein